MIAFAVTKIFVGIESYQAFDIGYLFSINSSRWKPTKKERAQCSHGQNKFLRVLPHF